MVWHGGEWDAQSLEGKMALKIGKKLGVNRCPFFLWKFL